MQMMVAAEPVQFLAPDHTAWTVHEIRDPHNERGYCLIFVSEHGFRRVREYPTEWRELSPLDLWALSWNR